MERDPSFLIGLGDLGVGPSLRDPHSDFLELSLGQRDVTAYGGREGPTPIGYLGMRQQYLTIGMLGTDNVTVEVHVDLLETQGPRTGDQWKIPIHPIVQFDQIARQPIRGTRSHVRQAPGLIAHPMA